MRRISAISIIAALSLAACGGDDGSSADTVSSPPATAPVATEAPATEPPETEPAVTEPVPTETAATDAAPSGAVAVSMVEWAVEAPSPIAAGTVTFDVANNGNFAHHFAIARGDSYETLPLLANGAVDEATLDDDYLGRTENLQSGETATIEFDLSPGNYVLFCNITAGPTNHASRGQVLSITVE